MKCPLRLFLCEESPRDLINVLGPFSVIFSHEIFDKVKFTYISSARETMRKSTKIVRFFSFQLKFVNFHSWCLVLELISGLPGSCHHVNLKYIIIIIKLYDM